MDAEAEEEVVQTTQGETPTVNWGDNINSKQKLHFRILTININGLPQQQQHPKYGIIREQVAKCKVDILGLSETNLKWNQFSTYDRLSQRTSKWWENTHCSYSYNSHDVSTSKFQPGGTAILSKNHLSNRALSQRQQDPSGLGRWCSTLYQGKNRTLLRLIQVYRPCKPNPNSNNGAYQQHSRFFLHKEITTCPRDKFLIDLQTFLLQCKNNNEQIIVMGDFNDDINKPPISNFFDDLDMKNLLSNIHDFNPSNQQSTFNRGHATIDGIFATHGISAIRGGYLNAHCFDTDHKPIWIDLPLHSVFGTTNPPLTPHHCRRLKNEDPRVVTKFNEEYDRLLSKHNLHQALHTLSQTTHHSLTPLQQREYERIDKLRTTSMIKAEKKCRRLKTGNIEFSPILQHQRDLIRFWKLILKRKKGAKTDTRYLSRWERKLNLEDTFHTPIHIITLHIKNAYNQYSLLKKQHSILRDEWIEQLAAARAEAGQSSSANELHSLRQKEKIRRAHRQIRWCLHHESITGPIMEVTEIENTTVIQHNDKCSVEQAILTANDNKYRQTNDTPPMTTLFPILGRFGITPAAHQILNGTFQSPPHLDIYTKKLLKELAMPTHIRHKQKINTTLTTSDYIQGWAKMNERTTSGLSNIHFGHHLACTKHTSNAKFEAQMCAIPYNTGYSPKRYQKSINAMLLKKAGRTDVASLRTIVLLEPDFNFMNKKLGKDVMNYAEKHKLIAPEQFGSRKKHSSIDQVLIKTLFYDALRIKKQDGYLCSNDAKACYDRICHSIASLALQRVGLPIGPILSMLQSLQNMKHHVRTGYGLSTASYGKSLINGKPVQGSGQGNGASPCIWVMISTPLLNLMRKENFGSHFIAPLTKEKISFVGCSFVDDTDLVYTAFDSETPLEDITPHMQRAIDTWEGGLRATGGALVPEKSWIFPIKYVWNDKGEATLEHINNLDIQFTVKNSHQELKQLPIVSPSEAKETLGVFIAPNGSTQTQVTYLKSKVTQWADKIRTHHISPQNAMLSIHSTILSTLKYPAPALSLNKKDWKSITSPLHQIGLQSAGISNKIPTAIRHGATKNLGFNIPCMYITQGILKLMKYLTFVKSQSILGQMIRLCEETTKIELGLPSNLYTTPYQQTHFLTTPSWIKQLWQFTDEYNILLQDQSPNLPTTTNNDFFLMDLFLKGGFKKWELLALNKCRIHLKVMTVGDIITGDGKYITPSIKHGQRNSSFTSTMHWPNQKDPGIKAWSIWRRAIKKVLEFEHKLHPHLQPTAWIDSPHRKNNWYYNRGLDRLFQRSNNNKWNFFVRNIGRGRQRRQPIFHYRGTFNSLPPLSTPASVTHLNIHMVKYTGTLRSLPTTNPPQNTNSFQSITATIPLHQRSPILDISHLDELPHIISSIRQGNCAIVSDGSFFPTSSRAAAAFVVGNEAAHRRIIGRCHVAGPPSAYSAYRSELAGIHAGLMFLTTICSAYNIHQGSILFACDNMGALQRIVKGTIRVQDQHFDYLSAIITLLKDLQITINFVHVDGHKDRDMAIENLSITESMNVSADTHAKVKAEEEPYENFHHTAAIYKEWPPIKIKQNTGFPIKIHSRLDKSLYDIITTSASRTYWQKKMRIPTHLRESVDWESIGNAFAKLPKNKQKEVLKWNTGFCGTGVALLQRKHATSAECPGCHHPKEDTVHILQCPASEATKEWNTAVEKLEQWMKKNHGAPELIEAITTGLRAWRNNQPALHRKYSLPGLSTAVQHQNLLGWKGFVHGFVSTHWKHPQDIFLQYKSSRKTGKRWIESLIKKLWETIWAIWRYRNGLVHQQSNTPLHKLTTLLNIEALKELQHGLSGLPDSYAYLFKQKMSKVLKTSINQKKQWLLTVWVARDTLTPDHISTNHRHPLISSILTAWKQRIKQYESHQNTRT